MPNRQAQNVVLSLSLVCFVFAAGCESTRRSTDEQWLTRMCLFDMGRWVSRFIEIGDSSDQNALRTVRTIDELWILLHKKHDAAGPLVPQPIDESYLHDGWGRPYNLEITSPNPKNIKVRISSNGDATKNVSPLFAEISYDGKNIKQKLSWQVANDIQK